LSDPQPPWLIEKILPAREISLVAGPSGAGKTKWLLQTLIGWKAGLPVLGQRSHPVPWIYASADRSIEGVKRNMDDMGLDFQLLPLLPAWDERMSLSAIFDAAKKAGARLLVIEAFGSFVDPPGRGNQVKAFMSSVSAMLRMEDMTVIGVMESPKMKPRERYENPRQRISGVAAWGHFSETVILIEPAHADTAGPERILWLCPRNAPMVKYDCQLTAHLQVTGISLP